ncbi:glycosyltransferase family 4 protein [Pontibacter toksunensis]|uniref:Glycosyltransferase family 4 protein n=1 Tax=Pontibacter toksunensis TaxID=1332631 RepID=A0ABW6BMP1_9BACT
MPKKILFFCGANYVFGKEVVTFNLIKELREKGVHVHCIVNGWNDGDFIKRLKAEGVSYNEVKLGFFYLNKPLWTIDSLIHYPGAFFKLRSILCSFSPDSIYFTSEREMLSVYPLVKKHKIILYLMEPIANSRLNNFITKAFKNKELTYVACSEYIKKKLSLLGSLDKAQIKVVFNSIEVKDKPAKISTSDDIINVGIVGQIRYHKGHDILIKALAKLKNYKFSCSVYGSGDSSYQAELKKLSSDLGIADRVHFKGYEKDIDRIYSNLDIVVVPTRSEEPLALAAMEPAQWKIPVIVSDQGGLPEAIVDKKTGFIFANEREADLADKLELLFKDRELRQYLGANAFSRVDKTFNRSVMAESFLKIIS